MRRSLIVMLAVVIMLLLAACGDKNDSGGTRSVVFERGNGNRIECHMSEESGYKLSSGTPFEVTDEDGLLQAIGMFADRDEYSRTWLSMQDGVSAGTAEYLSDGSRLDGSKYLGWVNIQKDEYGAEWREWNYILQVDGTDTCVLLTSAVSQRVIEDVFGAMSVINKNEE